MRFMAIGLVMTMAVHARADEPSTAEFLGAEATWGRARLELRDVHALWGGTDVVVEGSGRVVVQVVERGGRDAKRFETTIPAEEAVALLRRAVDADLANLPPPGRMGVPDEARVTLVLRDARGLARSVWKWDRDPSPPFDGVRSALAALASAVQERGPPTREAYVHGWQPFEAIDVTVSMYSGRRDPSFELLDDVDVEAVRERLRELPPAERVEPPGLGYRGFRLDVRGHDGLPREVIVFGGTLRVDGRVVRDAHDLEGWLKRQARSRAIDVP